MAVALSASFPLAELPARQAGLRPDAVALRFEGRDLSYDELAGLCERLAAQLQHDWRVQPGDHVAWLGANHPGQLMLLFALARLGALLLPLNFRLAPGELDAQIADCRPSHLVYDEAWAAPAQERARRNGLAAHPVDALLHDGRWDSATSAGVPESPLLLVYTSGTSSGPKAAVHTQAHLLANMQIAAAVQQITPQDKVATVLPLFHVGGLCIQTLPALYAGAQVILHARFAPDAALACFEQDRPTLTLQVPATLKALIEHPRWPATNLSSLRALWAGSSLLPAPLIEAFHARGVPVCNVYGATETGPFSIALPMAQARSHVGSCGWPAPGVEVRLEPGPRGDGAAPANALAQQEGEVWVRGPNVIEHYWPQRPACDAEGWFHTGDLARVADDGSYTIVGRASDLIISGGENIHPAEIETLLAQHPAVAECAAFGVADPTWGEVVAVAVVPRPGMATTQEELRAHLAAGLARYKLPRRWLWPAALPRTALGKLQRQALAQLPAEAPPSGAPRA